MLLFRTRELITLPTLEKLSAVREALSAAGISSTVKIHGAVRAWSGPVPAASDSRREADTHMRCMSASGTMTGGGAFLAPFCGIYKKKDIEDGKTGWTGVRRAAPHQDHNGFCEVC